MMNEIANRIFGKENRTYLMGIAILWIVAFHVYLWCDMSGIETTRWIRIFNKGALGVDIFLLLSAFGLQASIERHSIGKFYINRVKRLFPVYLFFLLTLFLTFERDCPIDRMMIQSVCQITGLSLFKYPEFFSCGFCFDWFTPAIIILYLVFPLFSWAIVRITKRRLCYELISLVLLVVIGVWIRENKHFPFGLFAIRMPIMYLGVISYLHIKNRENKRLLIIILVAALLGLFSGNDEMRISLLLPPLLIVFASSEVWLPFKRFVRLVGRHSYEVYLAHIFAVAFFIPTKMVTNIFLLLFITIVSTIVLSAIYAYIQGIVTKLGKHDNVNRYDG